MVIGPDSFDLEGVTGACNVTIRSLSYEPPVPKPLVRAEFERNGTPNESLSASELQSFMERRVIGAADGGPTENLSTRDVRQRFRKVQHLSRFVEQIGASDRH
ncbi:hypothetical protein BH11ARM2_BH11ARM2_25540 [soil metagenome]